MCRWREGGGGVSGLGRWGKISVHIFLENIDRRSHNDGSQELTPCISQPSPKNLTRYFDSDSYLGVPCRGALQGCVEWEGEKTTSNPHPKDSECLECANQVSPKLSVLQRMKAQGR